MTDEHKGDAQDRAHKRSLATSAPDAVAVLELKAALATWDALAPDNWRQLGLPFAVVLTRRADTYGRIIMAARKVVG